MMLTEPVKDTIVKSINNIYMYLKIDSRLKSDNREDKVCLHAIENEWG